MLYSILVFGAEGVVEALSEVEQEAVLKVHRDLKARLEKDGTYRTSVQLMPPSTASHVRLKQQKTIVMDGPFMEAKEQFLGFYIIECADMEYALEAAGDLPQGIANAEVRAVSWAGGQLTDGRD
jgi:hypothetical protein